MVYDEKNRHSRMQRKIKVTMPKSKKQLEHTYTFHESENNLNGIEHFSPMEVYLVNCKRS